MIEDCLQTISDEIDFIYVKEDAFVNQFIGHPVMALYKISFDDKYVDIVYVLDNGVHVSNSIDINLYLEWRHSYDETTV